MSDVAHYLDHAAGAPPRQCAIEAWVRASRELALAPGNPSALHSGGRAARRMLEDARERIAGALGADRAEVVLTSGATESDALAVAGGARGARAGDRRRTHVLVSRVEHDAVAAQRGPLTRDGFQWDVLPLGSNGVSVVEPHDLSALAPHLAVASLAMVCSEVGTIQPVDDLVTVLGAGARAGGGPHGRPLVHTDAAQALTCLDVDFHAVGVDLLTVGGHKVGAPAGVGALLVRRGTPLVTDRPGGGHERGLRSGTPDVAGACALAAALEQTVSERAGVRRRLGVLTELLVARLPAGARPTVPAGTARVPSILHLSLDTAHPEAVLLRMDAAGVLVSAGSACHAGVTRPSRIVMDMGRTEHQALGVLRVSMGASTTEDDVRAFLAALPGAIAAGRALDRREPSRRQEVRA